MKLMPKNWLPLAVTIFLMTGLTYISVQQSLRQSANDPQVQLSEDVAAKLAKGDSAESMTSLDPGLSPVDAAHSLAPFVIIYDESGNPVAGNGRFGNDFKTPPKGVFDWVKKNGQHRFSWQTAEGLRFAAVVSSTGTNQPLYIMAARSLREVENREQRILFTCVLGGLVAWAAAWILLQRKN